MSKPKPKMVQVTVPPEVFILWLKTFGSTSHADRCRLYNVPENINEEADELYRKFVSSLKDMGYGVITRSDPW